MSTRRGVPPSRFFSGRDECHDGPPPCSARSPESPPAVATRRSRRVASVRLGGRPAPKAGRRGAGRTRSPPSPPAHDGRTRGIGSCSLSAAPRDVQKNSSCRCQPSRQGVAREARGLPQENRVERVRRRRAPSTRHRPAIVTPMRHDLRNRTSLPRTDHTSTLTPEADARQ